jgi:hypothetical protein
MKGAKPMLDARSRMRNPRFGSRVSSPASGPAKLQASNLQAPEKFQAPNIKCATVRAHTGIYSKGFKPFQINSNEFKALFKNYFGTGKTRRAPGIKEKQRLTVINSHKQLYGGRLEKSRTVRLRQGFGATGGEDDLCGRAGYGCNFSGNRIRCAASDCYEGEPL